MKSYTYEVWQDGMKVAAVTADDESQACNEAFRYAVQYSEDGPVELHGPDGPLLSMKKVARP